MAQFRGGECYVTAKKIMNTHKHQHTSSHTHIHTSTPKRSLPHNIYCWILSTSFSLCCWILSTSFSVSVAWFWSSHPSSRARERDVMADLLNMNLTGDTQASVASVNAAMSKLQVDAATRDYIVTPRLEYRTVSGVSGPLVILDKVRRRATKTKHRSTRLGIFLFVVF